MNLNTDYFIEKFASQLTQVPDFPLTLQTHLRDIPSWDSLTAMAINSMIDFEYGIDIEFEAFEGFATLGDIYNFIHLRNGK